RILKRVGASFNGRARLLDVLTGFPHCTPRLPPPVLCSEPPWCLRLRSGDREFVLRRYFNTHGPRSTFYALYGRVQGRRIQVRHLLLGDVQHLLLGDLADLVLVRRTGPLRHSRSPLQQNRSWRRLGNKAERAIAVHGHHDRNDQPIQFLGAGLRIELFAELHDVDLRLTERRANWRSRSGLARCNLQLHRTCSFLCHVYSSKASASARRFMNWLYSKPALSSAPASSA